MIIGLTGPNAAGKGEAALYLKSKGFIYHSLSDILREESAKLGIASVRKNLINLGNDLRRKNGPAFLAVRIIGTLTSADNHIVDSIRNPAEVEALRKTGNFTLIGIDAPSELRYKRSLLRKRPGDAKTLREFIEKEKKENKTNIENQQLKKCLEIANVVILNNTTIKEFHRKLDETIKTLRAS